MWFYLESHELEAMLIALPGYLNNKYEEIPGRTQDSLALY